MKRSLRCWLARCAGCTLLLFGLAASLGWVWLRRSLPRMEGTLVVSNIDEPVEIVRDREAIPHVFARSEHDASFGLGFSHGQDRLWQLELTRRAASGRLSEVFGAETLQDDRLMRALRLRSVAERSLPELEASSRLTLERYAAGINAARAATPVLPVEFLIFGVKPEPWTVVDSLVVFKLLGWQLNVQLGRELLRAQLAERLSSTQIAELLGGDASALATARESLGAFAPAFRALGSFERGRSLGSSVALGSNSWAISGAHTRSGLPLLANDPHLGLSMPAVWYLAHLSAPGLDVAGATIPGLPGVILGRNEHVAWGFTNNRVDTLDLYLERVLAGAPERYATPTGSEPFERIEEEIRVKGQASELLRLRSTRHGVVLSDVDEVARKLMPDGYVLSLKWAALLPGDVSVQFPLKAARARNVRALLDAAQQLSSPPQNIVCADDAGGLGFVAAGRVPRRAEASARGLVPMPGWLEEHDWQGFLPFDSLPRFESPERDRVVSANQNVMPDGYPHWLGADWAATIRAERIQSELSRNQTHDVGTFAALQLDERSPRAEQLVALLSESARAALPARVADVARRLRAWDFVMRVEAAEPLIYAEWLHQLLRAVYADELGPRLDDVQTEASERLTEILTNDHSRWCDDVNTPAAEACATIAVSALSRAVAALDERYGDDVGQWRWGRAHSARFSHAALGSIPLLGRWFDTEVPSGGGNDTVNLSEYLEAGATRDLDAQYGPSYRAIYDLSEREGSSFVVAVGQSGNPLSPYYRNWASRWQRGERVPMWRARKSVEADAMAHLRLVSAAR
ncbi:MAG: penicillin acylase family protein [Polyangiaceae bacterium]